MYARQSFVAVSIFKRGHFLIVAMRRDVSQSAKHQRDGVMKPQCAFVTWQKQIASRL
jgi:hypothetical protein